MKGKPLFPIPNETRESWCFLALGVDEKDSRITDWYVGDGNALQLVNQTKSSSSEEEELLQSLCEELASRQYQEVVLTTTSSETLAILRSRLLSADVIREPSLRGYRHLSLQEVIERYFVADLFRELFSSEMDPDESYIEEMWRVRKDLGPLTPISDLRGTRL